MKFANGVVVNEAMFCINLPTYAFCTCSETFERTIFLTFENQSKKFNCSILFLLAIKVQNTFKILHYGVKF